MQYKAKHASLKGQGSETGGLNYGIFPYAPPQKRKRLTGNKLIANQPYFSQNCDQQTYQAEVMRAKTYAGILLLMASSTCLYPSFPIFPSLMVGLMLLLHVKQL